LDYAVDWREWLAPDGDTITDSAWTAEPGITIEQDPAPTATGGVVTVWLSGGVTGRSYLVTNRITTALGRVDERSFTLGVLDR
jgi:hypothetical protein